MVITTVQLHPFRKSFFSTILYLFGGYLTADSTSSSAIIATSLLLPSSSLAKQSGGGGSAGSGAGSASNGTSGNGNGPATFTGAAAPRSAKGFNWWEVGWGWIIAAGVIACVGAVVVE